MDRVGFYTIIRYVFKVYFPLTEFKRLNDFRFVLLFTKVFGTFLRLPFPRVFDLRFWNCVLNLSIVHISIFSIHSLVHLYFNRCRKNKIKSFRKISHRHSIYTSVLLAGVLQLIIIIIIWIESLCDFRRVGSNMSTYSMTYCVKCRRKTKWMGKVELKMTRNKVPGLRGKCCECKCNKSAFISMCFYRSQKEKW